MNYLNVTAEKLKNKENVFLTGGAGVGKTTLTKQIIEHFEEDGKKVAKLASTGMAATLINGQTLHSFFDLGIASCLDELEQNNKLQISKKVKKLISSMHLIVIDEISMVSDLVLELIFHRLSQADFNGSILVVGDFLQLPPIIKNSNNIKFAFESIYWKNLDFFKIELTHIYRTDDKEFIKLLNNIRNGFINEEIHNELNTYIKPLSENLNNFTFLFGKNISASNHNKRQLEFINNDLFIKKVQITKHIKNIPQAQIQRFIQDARIEESLELKVGAPVLFTRNSWNYFNGERGIIVNVDENFIYIQKSNSKIIKLEPVSQSKTVWKEKTVNGKKELVEENTFTIHQYPIKLAFAITIHKSQGMSIDNLIIQTNEIFAPSQFYVALSRSSNPKNLNLIAPNRQWHELVFINKKALKFYT